MKTLVKNTNIIGKSYNFNPKNNKMLPIITKPSTNKSFLTASRQRRYISFIYRRLAPRRLQTLLLKQFDLVVTLYQLVKRLLLKGRHFNFSGR